MWYLTGFGKMVYIEDMEAIEGKRHWPGEVTRVTPEVAELSQETEAERDTRVALRFLRGRPLNASGHDSEFVINGYVLSFTGGNKVF